jgi:hypothetical protein
MPRLFPSGLAILRKIFKKILRKVREMVGIASETLFERFGVFFCFWEEFRKSFHRTLPNFPSGVIFLYMNTKELQAQIRQTSQELTSETFFTFVPKTFLEMLAYRNIIASSKNAQIKLWHGKWECVENKEAFNSYKKWIKNCDKRDLEIIAMSFPE